MIARDLRDAATLLSTKAHQWLQQNPQQQQPLDGRFHDPLVEEIDNAAVEWLALRRMDGKIS